jgi:molybdopterin molybdotransferase
LWAEPFKVQDSSMLSVFAAADALVLRTPHAPAATAGDRIDIIVLD